MSMYPEYLYNNDTQDICRRVSELAKSNEPALRAQCQEVSRQTDTSSLAVIENCTARIRAADAVFDAMVGILKDLSRDLSSGSGVLATRDGQTMFPKVCRAIVLAEEERQRLLSSVAELTQARRELASSVADANRVLHFLSLARSAISTEVHSCYTENITCINRAYARLTQADAAVREVQNFYMTLIESHLSVFMQRLRVAADFHHTGAALDRAGIRRLCEELFVLQNRSPNVSF